MKTIITIKEYETIVRGEKTQKVGAITYLKTSTFNDLKKFVQESNQGEEINLLSVLKLGYNRFYGDTITPQNYVGLIEMRDGTQIEILPKISLAEEDKNNSVSKKVFLKMLKSLKEFSGKTFDGSKLDVERMSLNEVFISMFVQEVRSLIKKGVKSFYEQKEDNLNVFKGKLKIGEQLRLNNVHKERFYVEYDEYTSNRPENRLIKSTLLKLETISTYYKNLNEIRNLIYYFDLIDVSYNYESDFAKVVIDRTSKDYQVLMNWARIFLFNKSFSTFSGSTVSRSILFPMEKVFEQYVASQLSRCASPYNLRIAKQERRHYLFDEPSRFALRPDIVVYQDNKKVVLDTKWKRLISQPNSNYGVSQEDMYQMFAYAKKYDASAVYLIYPKNFEKRPFKDDYTTFKGNDGVIVHVYEVDLNEPQTFNKLLTFIHETNIIN
ncbi:MAG: McrC family protein [Acholeplasmataceae bacterium]